LEEEERQREREKKPVEVIFKELLYKDDNLDTLHKQIWTKLSSNQSLTDKIDLQLRENDDL
jgi:hypothetical protein